MASHGNAAHGKASNQGLGSRPLPFDGVSHPKVEPVMLRKSMPAAALFILLTFTWAFARKQDPILVIDPQGHSAMIHDVLFAPDGETLISLSMDKTIRFWDVPSGDLVKTLRAQIGEAHEGTFHAGALSPDGQFLAVAGWPYGDGDYGIPVFLFDLNTDTLVGLLKGHTDLIGALDFSRDGKYLASGGDNTVRIWDTRNFSGNSPEAPTLAPLATLQGHSDGILDVSFAPDSRFVVSSSYDHTVRLWELSADRSKAVKTTLMKKHEDVVEQVGFAPNGQYIVSGGGDVKILLWDSKGKLIKEIAEQYPGTISFSADSSKIVVVGTPNEPATVYAIPSGKVLSTFSKHTNDVCASAFFGNDIIATAGGDEKEIYVWEADTGRVKAHMVGRGRPMWAVAVNEPSQREGQGLQVAFGNTNTNAGKLNPGAENFTQWADHPRYVPLEKSFDFSEMRLKRTLPDKTRFHRSRTYRQGLKLDRIGFDELSLSNGQRIKNSGYGDDWIRSYTLAPGGDVVTGSAPRIKKFGRGGEVLSEFFGHTDIIWALAASEDGRYLVSAGDDQMIKVWNLKTAECLATLYVTTDNEWVCWTPQGYYAASAGGEKYMGWHLNRGLGKAAKFYPVSVFRGQFHHPEIVKQTIALGSFTEAFEAVNARARRKIEQKPVTELLPPGVVWNLPQRHTSRSDQPAFRIQARIVSDSQIKEVRVLVNGRAQVEKRGMVLGSEPQTATEINVDENITLAPGRNEIAIFAANRDAGATSDDRIVEYVSGQADWRKPNVYMVSVGVSDYLNDELDLGFANNDAKAMSRVFKDQEGKLYSKVAIRELCDADATRGNVLDAMEWLGRETTQKDVAVIFMAAHGINDDRGKFYVIPADGDPDKLRRTCVDWGDFKEVLGNLPSRVILFLDTCHSGQLGQNLFRMRGAGRTENTEAIRELASDENGVVILAASTGAEFSVEHSDWGHGAFTKALLEGFQTAKADYSKDGIIHLREIDTYISERVKSLTAGSQHPTTVKPSTISRFPIVQLK
jgi:WD40 repeat protein